MAENGELSFEEGFAWLASDILDDPLYDPNEEKLMNQKQQHHHHHQQKLGRLNMFMEPVLQRPRPNHRPKSPTNWASGGSGMQAIFLESGQKTCGTGVFIPRSKKPACSPVLLPARVVQALNLNVHALGLQVSPNKDTKGNMNKEVRGVKCENENKDVSSTKSSVHSCAISRTSSSSADVFLPKEWTY